MVAFEVALFSLFWNIVTPNCGLSIFVTTPSALFFFPYLGLDFYQLSLLPRILACDLAGTHRALHTVGFYRVGVAPFPRLALFRIF